MEKSKFSNLKKAGAYLSATAMLIGLQGCARKEDSKCSAAALASYIGAKEAASASYEPIAETDHVHIERGRYNNLDYRADGIIADMPYNVDNQDSVYHYIKAKCDCGEGFLRKEAHEFDDGKVTDINNDDYHVIRHSCDCNGYYDEKVPHNYTKTETAGGYMLDCLECGHETAHHHEWKIVNKQFSGDNQWIRVGENNYDSKPVNYHEVDVKCDCGETEKMIEAHKFWYEGCENENGTHRSNYKCAECDQWINTPSSYEYTDEKGHTCRECGEQVGWMHKLIIKNDKKSECADCGMEFDR